MESPDLFHELQKPPDIFGVIGFLFFVAAVGSVLTGKAPSRGGVIYRAKNPKSFWLGVAVYSLSAVFFIGLFLVGSS